MSGRAAAKPPYYLAGEFASSEAASEIRNSTGLFTNLLTASPLASPASLPKQKHSRAKSRQLRRLEPSVLVRLLRWLNRVMQDHEARASDLNRKLIFSFFLLFS